MPTSASSFFINGTSPESGSELEAETEATPEADASPSPELVMPPMVVEPLAEPLAEKSLRARNCARARVDGWKERLRLDIDPTTGLIAVESCPVIRTRTFALGTEPKKYCGPEYHQQALPLRLNQLVRGLQIHKEGSGD